MQISHLEYQLNDSILTQRKLRFRVGPTDVQFAIDRAAEKILKDVEVPGFRIGKGPVHLVRKHHVKRVNAMAFDELKRAAIDQVIKQLPDKDHPFLPPEVEDSDKVKLVYGKHLEFSVKYMVDPAGISKRPEQPDFQQGSTIPGAQINPASTGPMGIPRGPQLPQAPDPAKDAQQPIEQTDQVIGSEAETDQ